MSMRSASFLRYWERSGNSARMGHTRLHGKPVQVVSRPESAEESADPGERAIGNLRRYGSSSFLVYSSVAAGYTFTQPMGEQTTNGPVTTGPGATLLH